jgi:hypothetical protein
MTKKTLVIGAVTLTALLAGGWALAQSVGPPGGVGPPDEKGGHGPGMMKGMRHGTGPGMKGMMMKGMGGHGPGMMKGMGHGPGMMQGMDPGMMHGRSGEAPATDQPPKH